MSFASSFQEKFRTTPVFVKRHRWVLGSLAVLLLVYAGIGFLWLPRFARDAAIRYVATDLHRQLSIGEVRFNPFTLTARLHDVRLREADGSLIAGIKELVVNAEVSSLWHRAYTFKQVRITAPVIHSIVNADGSLNLAALKPASNTPRSDHDQSLPAVRIGSLELSSGELQFTDRSRPETPFTTTLKPIRFTLQNFRTKPNYGNAFRINATSESGEHFDWQGNFTVQPVAARGQLLISKLRADTIQDYLQDALPLRLLSGNVSLQGEYEIALGQQPGDQPEVQLRLADITVNDTRIAPRTDVPGANDSAWVTLPRLRINDLKLSLQRRSVSIKQLTGEHAELQAWLDEQHNLNLLALRGPPSASTSPPWTLTVDDITFDQAAVHAEDRGVKPAAQFVLQPVTLKAQHYSNAPGATLQLDANIGVVNRVEPAAQLQAQGTLKLDDMTTDLQVQLQHFELPALQGYVAQTTDLMLLGGRANATGKLHYRAAAKSNNKPMNLAFDGEATIADLNTQDSIEHNDFIKWREVQLKKVSFGLNPDQLSIAQVNALKPYGRIVINADATTNVQQILRLKKSKPVDDGQPDQNDQATTATGQRKQKAAPGMRIRIAKVIIDDGSTNFADFTVKPSFGSGIQALYGTISNLSSANDSRAKVDLKGQVDSYSPVSITGTANFLAADTYSDVAMNFRNIDLTIFNPYSGKFAGYSIAKGKLSTELRYRISNRQLDLQHHIVVDQLEFGSATDSKDKVPLPVKLAAALLKDRHGVIDLNLPVNGSLDDPKFKLGPLIWKAFVGLLDRIVTSPFRALGALFGRGEELAYVDFKPGSMELDAEQHDKLDKLAQALVERPQLRLEIPLSTASDVDAAALNRMAMEQALVTYLPKSGTTTPTQRLSALTSLYKKQLNAEPAFDAPTNNKADVTAQRIGALEQALLPYFSATAEQRDQLTHQRAAAVQATLLMNHELSPERIFMTARPNDTQSPDGVVRMALQLQ